MFGPEIELREKLRIVGGSFFVGENFAKEGVNDFAVVWRDQEVIGRTKEFANGPHFRARNPDSIIKDVSDSFHMRVTEAEEPFVATLDDFRADPSNRMVEYLLKQKMTDVLVVPSSAHLNIAVVFPLQVKPDARPLMISRVENDIPKTLEYIRTCVNLASEVIAGHCALPTEVEAK